MLTIPGLHELLELDTDALVERCVQAAPEPNLAWALWFHVLKDRADELAVLAMAVLEPELPRWHAVIALARRVGPERLRRVRAPLAAVLERSWPLSAPADDSLDALLEVTRWANHLGEAAVLARLPPAASATPPVAVTRTSPAVIGELVGARLVVWMTASAGGATTVHRFDRDQVDVGRDDSRADLVINRGNLSARQCRFLVRDQRVIVVSLGDSPTWLHGRAITTPQVIGPDDTVYVSDFALQVAAGLSPRVDPARGAALATEPVDSLRARLLAEGRDDTLAYALLRAAMRRDDPVLALVAMASLSPLDDLAWRDLLTLMRLTERPHRGPALEAVRELLERDGAQTDDHPARLRQLQHAARGRPGQNVGNGVPNSTRDD